LLLLYRSHPDSRHRPRPHYCYPAVLYPNYSCHRLASVVVVVAGLARNRFLNCLKFTIEIMK
jgi:hypothetical protein